MYWAHFFSFFWVAKQGSSVAAGVNKAIQGTTIFTLSHIFFCPGGPSLLMEPHDEEQFLLADPGDGVEKQQVWPVLCTAQNLDAQCFDFFKGLAYPQVSSGVSSKHSSRNTFVIVDVE